MKFEIYMTGATITYKGQTFHVWGVRINEQHLAQFITFEEAFEYIKVEIVNEFKDEIAKENETH